MDAKKYDAFWSYAHDDDLRFKGRLGELAVAIQDEFALISGDELDLFVDRKELRWGDLWREKVDEAVGQSPFFIPIITPKFVRSPECRREFLAFSAAAKSRGLDNLLLPILYIDVKGLDENSDDKMLALVARTQYVDWRELRFAAHDSPDFLTAVNKLATSLQKRQEEASKVVMVQEARTGEQLASEIDDVVPQILDKLEDWMASVEFDKIAGAQWSAATDERLQRIERLQQNHSPRGTIVSTLYKLSLELLPLARDRLEKAKNYARLTIELDPLVNRAMALIALDPSKADRLNPLRDGANEAYLNMLPQSSASSYALPKWVVRANTHLQEADALIDKSVHFVKEGNEIVLTWRDKLMTHTGSNLIPIIVDSAEAEVQRRNREQ